MDDMYEPVREIDVTYRDRQALIRSYLPGTPHGGLLVSAERPIEVDETVELNVWLRREDIREYVLGVVLWCRSRTRDTVQAGVGFLACEAYKRELLLRSMPAGGGGAADRRQERHEMAIKVVYRTSMDFVVDYTRNLSLGGMFVKADRLPPVGTRILFKLCPPEPLDRIELLGRVTWHCLGEGFGIRFVDTRGRVRGKLEQLVRTIPIDPAQASGPPRLLEDEAAAG